MNIWLIVTIIIVVIYAVTVVFMRLFYKIKQTSTMAIAESTIESRENKRILQRLLKTNSAQTANINDLKGFTNNGINELKDYTTNEFNSIKTFTSNAINELKTYTINELNGLKSYVTSEVNEIRLLMNEDKMKLKFHEEKLHKLDLRVSKLNSLLIEMDNNCASIHGKKLAAKKTTINLNGNNNNIAQDIESSSIEESM